MVAARAGSATERVVTGGQLGILLGQVANDEAVWGGAIVGVDVADDESGLDVVLRTGPRPPVPDPALASTIAGLYARAGARRRDPIHVRIEHEPYRRVLVRADDVAGFGWKAWSPDRPAVAGRRPSPPPATPTTGFTLANGLVTVAVDPTDGTFAIDGLQGLDLLVDDADAGDTYNYSPPEGDIAVDAPTSVAVDIHEHGPLRASLRVVRTFEWPERLEAGGNGSAPRTVEVSTRLELRAGERLVRVTTSLDNPCRDHRLRAWFPLPSAGHHLPGRVRLRHRRAGPAGRGRGHRAGPADVPVPPVRDRRRAHRRPRGPARIRAGRRRQGPRPHPAALRRRAVGHQPRLPADAGGPARPRARGPRCTAATPSATRWPSAMPTPTPWSTTPSSPCWSPPASGAGTRPATGSGPHRHRRPGVGGAATAGQRRPGRGPGLQPGRRGGHRRPRRAHRLAGRPARPPPGARHRLLPRSARGGSPPCTSTGREERPRPVRTPARRCPPAQRQGHRPPGRRPRPAEADAGRPPGRHLAHRRLPLRLPHPAPARLVGPRTDPPRPALVPDALRRRPTDVPAHATATCWPACRPPPRSRSSPTPRW